MSGISCHVLDTALGRPATGVEVYLERLADAAGAASWVALGRALTNTDGRAMGLEAPQPREIGLHRLTFETEAYFLRTGQPLFYPRVRVEFLVASLVDKYHVPLLLSPFGYSTYRGS
jgi:5-hydroxyisourate hydrolase